MFYATNVDWDELKVSDNMHVNMILMWQKSPTNLFLWTWIQFYNFVGISTEHYKL